MSDLILISPVLMPVTIYLLIVLLLLLDIALPYITCISIILETITSALEFINILSLYLQHHHIAAIAITVTIVLVVEIVLESSDVDVLEFCFFIKDLHVFVLQKQHAVSYLNWR